MTATLAPPKPRAFYASDATRASFWGHKMTTGDDGKTLIEGIEIFRVGTFRDSMGDQMTWELEHLHQMVANFDLLREKQIFVNAPVREDHSFTVTKVIGYIDKLYVKDDKLLADVTITEPEGAEKIARTTYRSVSNEVGLYETNDGAMYWPVVYGFAYVDLAAVEGLHSKNTNGVSVYARQTSTTKEPTVADNDTPVTDKAPDAPAASTHQFRIAGATTTDFAKVQAHIDSVESRNAALEATAKATDEKFRKDFVQGLVDKNMIAAPQKEATEKFALDLSVESFEAWRGTWEHAPAITLLQEHGADAAGTNKTEDQAKAEEIQTCKDTLEFSRRAGMSAEKLAKHPAAIKLAELTKN